MINSAPSAAFKASYDAVCALFDGRNPYELPSGKIPSRAVRIGSLRSDGRLHVGYYIDGQCIDKLVTLKQLCADHAAGFFVWTAQDWALWQYPSKPARSPIIDLDNLGAGFAVLLITAGIALLVLLAFVHPLAAIALVAVLWFLFSN